MNTVDISFSEFGPPIKLIIIDPKKYKSRFKSSAATNQQLKPPPRTDYSSYQHRSSVHQHHRVRQQNPATHATPSSTPTTNGGARSETASTAGEGDRSSSPEIIDEIDPPERRTKPKQIKHKARNDQLEVEEIDDDDDGSSLPSEQVTRLGRVSKKPKPFTNEGGIPPVASSTDTDSAPPQPKVRKRAPADVFRCKTCSKYYLGHTKLRLHYKKNPDHKMQPPERPEIEILKSITSVGVQANLPNSSCITTPDTALLLLNSTSGSTHPLTLEIDSDNSKPQRRRMLDPLTVPLTSGNVMSPGENSINAAMTLINEEFEFSEYQANKNNSTSTNSHQQCQAGSSISSDGTTTRSFTNVSLHLSPSPSFRNLATRTSHNSGNSTLPSFPSPISNNNNCRSSSPPICTSSPSPIEMDTSFTENSDSLDSCGNGKHPSYNDSANCNNNGSKVSTGKLIWEFIEEKMIREGINQILAEISEVADKLGKIARDKIIPIREEEEERLQSSVPIIQVDNPFLSHLLDLPFGTYIFKEDDDEESRRVKPPTLTELSQFSLTGGAEVDIDKFLRPDTVLPHLTNLDFNSICNNNANHGA